MKVINQNQKPKQDKINYIKKAVKGIREMKTAGKTKEN